MKELILLITMLYCFGFTAVAKPKIKFRTTHPKLTELDPTQYKPMIHPYGCFIAAIDFQHAYEVNAKFASWGDWSAIMYVDVPSPDPGDTGHALCVFHYEDEWWVYDSLVGTTRLGKYSVDPSPQEIATKVNSSYYHAKWWPKP